MRKLAVDFYYNMYTAETIIGDDYFEVLQKCCSEGILPTSCQCAVLSLIPKKEI